jgi:hypothetical protein
MNNAILSLCAVAILASAATAADRQKSSVGGQVGALEVGKSSAAAAPPAQKQCVSHCNNTERRCSSKVRRARSECSRNAANGGRDPLTGRNKDTSYFCGHFSRPEHECSRDVYGNACAGRYQYRYGVCVDAMYNIAAMRFDCIRSERDAMSFCREELRDCTAACQ